MKKHKDLFVNYKKQPKQLQTIIEKWGDVICENPDYRNIQNFLNDVESIGYTFEYYLDAEPFALRPKSVKLTDVEGYEDI